MSTEGPPPQLPDASDIVVSTAASLVNLAGIRLTEAEHKDPAKAKRPSRRHVSCCRSAPLTRPARSRTHWPRFKCCM